jgi:deoxyhypusine synthase
MAQQMGEEALFAKEPHARGYLRPRNGYRLYAMRDELVDRLNRDVEANREWLMESVRYLVA